MLATKIILANSDQVKGVVLLAHGMNNPPAVMDSLCEYLTQISFHAVRITLKGHEGSNQLKHYSSSEDWIENINQAYELVRTKYPNLPVYNLSFSLGCVITQCFLIKYPDKSFIKQILLGPAFKPRWFFYLLPFITWLRFFKISLISFVEKRYCLYRFLPISIINSLQETVKFISTSKDIKSYINIPTLLIISAKDELVDAKATKDWIKRANLNNWTIQYLKPTPNKLIKVQHLLVDPDCMGEKAWEELTVAIRNFFYD